MAGLEATGFVPKTQDEIIDELGASLRAVLGESLDTSAQSVLGQLIGILAEREADSWDVAQGVYGSFYPDTAEGAALDHVSAITGTIRQPARKSTVTITFSGTSGSTVVAGTVVSVTGTGARFVTLADATVGGGGTVDVEAESEDYGPISANAGTLTTLETSNAGVTGATNALDADLGALIETDAALRVRREIELRRAGLGALDAIRARLLNLEGVLAVSMYENTGEVTDGQGLPPKSFEAVVEGGDADEIRATIWSAKPAGIATHGTLTGTVVDSSGTNRTIKHSVPTAVNIYVYLEIRVNPLTFPIDGEDQIVTAITTWGDALPMAHDIYAQAVAAQAFTVPGVLDVTVVGISTSAITPPGVTTPIAIANREYPELDTSRITIGLITEVTP